MKRLLQAIPVAVAIALTTGAASAQSITIKSGPQGGVWYPVSVGMAGVIEDKTDLQVTIQAGGGISNAITTGRNEGQFGFSTPGDVAAVFEGIDDRPPEENLRTFGILYNQYYTLSVRGNSDIETVADLDGRALVTQRRGSSTEKITSDVLAAHGLSYDDLAKMNFAGSVGDATNQLRDNQVDAFSTLIAHPASYLLELSSAFPVRLISLEQDKIDQLVDNHRGYSPITIQAGTYEWLEEDVPTVNAPVMMVTNSEVSEEVVYQVAKALFESHETLVDVHPVMGEFTAENASAHPPVPIHPGALRYYREVGVIE